MFQKIFDARLRDLWTLYEATRELGRNGEKGLLWEVFLRRVVESLLPPQFAVGRGINIDAAGSQSPQVDLVIYDRRRLPPIFEEHGHGVYPIDAVLRVIEVKSVLDKAGLKHFVRLADALRPSNPEALRITAHGTLGQGQAYYLIVSLFAYRMSIIDVQKAVAKVATFDGISAPIRVVDQPSVGRARSRFKDKIRIFLIQLWTPWRNLRVQESYSGLPGGFRLPKFQWTHRNKRAAAAAALSLQSNKKHAICRTENRSEFTWQMRLSQV